jgi:creatinine amidohydrolase/Fe(II)-dependent formamide hydrolase-like protein
VKNTRVTAVLAIFAFAAIAAAQGQQTPEQREAAAKARYDKDAATPRPIAAVDSVWIEELTYLEVRDAMKAGKTTALIVTGSTEQNGPYLVGAKHNIVLRQTGEAIARKLGNALVAPIVPIEAGNPENKYLEWGSLYFTADTFKAVVRDMTTSLKSQGFKNIILIGDSGGDTAGLKAVAQELTARWNGTPGVYHIPEYYNWSQPGAPGGATVRQFTTENGIPEKFDSDGIHDDYGLTSVLMAGNPKNVRLDQRIAANKTTINGISIVPKEKTIEFGRKVVEWRANITVEAIKKALATRQSSQ